MGSSPLTRGKPLRAVLGKLSLGLIPAHAGKTLRTQEDGIIGGAHPRSRGENHVGHANGLPGGGLIPAHAGKTGIKTSINNVATAHPRSRGENAIQSWQ